MTRDDETNAPAARAHGTRRTSVLGPALFAQATALVMVACLAAAVPRVRTDAKPGTTASAVVTEGEPASRAAMTILRSGGNAADAAIAAALVGGVANPASSGLGGGGFALVWDTKTSHVTAWDFREISPSELDAAAFDRRPLALEERGKLIGVPGELAGLATLHRRFGRKPWRDVVAPSVRVAQDGYAVSFYVARAIGEKLELIAGSPALSDLFAPAGQPRPVGERVSNPRLAGTLARIAEQGPQALYEGVIASAIAASTSARGGTLTPEDLRRYAPKERTPLHVKWEGLDVYTMPPPSAGGIMLAQTLRAVSRSLARRFDPQSARYQHFLAELLRGSLSDRMRFIGDPDDTTVDLGFLLDERRLGARRDATKESETRPLPAFFSEEHGTHHIVTADADGNVVSLTTTINHGFGSGITADDTGIVLNDELDDFASTQGAARFGIAKSPNRARPGVRPVSSMAPTLVFKDGKPILAVGASGGFTIGPAIAQIVLSLLAFDLPPAKALEIPRFEIPTDGHTIALEPSVSQTFADELSARGESPVPKQSVSTPAVQLMTFRGSTKAPFADQRKRGVALAE